jgi:BMFP domain-containing protein YqiC
MPKLTILEQLATQLADCLPSDFTRCKEALKQNFHALLKSELGKLQILTRDEFEVQRQVLAKTRQKLEALEKIVVEMERRPLEG